MLQGDADSPDRQRVFGADVDIAFGGTHGVCGDGQAFDNGVGVCLQDRAVHEGAGISFVGVADDILLVARGVATELPLAAGRKAGATAPAEAGPLDLFNDLFGSHFQKSFLQGAVAVGGDVVVDLLGVNVSTVAQNDTLLLFVEIHL